jgi:LPXTG-motif cell wall-anchored protein
MFLFKVAGFAVGVARRRCRVKTTDYSTALVPETSGDMGMLPLIAGAGVILALAGAGAYLYMNKKKSP